MSEQMWWTRDEDGKEHPDDAALFAFVRDNLSEQDRQEVYRHLGVCSKCQDYCRVGRLIDKMQPIYEANESVADAVMVYINNPVHGWLRRQDRRLHRLPGDIEFVLAFVRYQIARWIQAFLSAFKSKEPSRLSRRPITRVSLAWVFALLLIAVVAAILLAPPLFNIHANPRGAGPHTGSSNIPSLPTPTATSKPTPIPTRTVAPPLAVLYQCGTTINNYQERVDICGSHFHPGDKLELWVYVAGGQPRPYRALEVNTLGQFQTFLVVTQCKETIKAIYVADITNGSVNPAPLTNIQVGKCEASPKR